MHPEITLIVAVTKNNGIAKNGQIPWSKVKEDLMQFRRQTVGQACVMGRKTWDSLPIKPLDKRENIVLSRSSAPLIGAVIYSSPSELFKAFKGEQLMVIGGGEIYKIFMPWATKVIITRIDDDVEGCDTFFPKMTSKAWQLQSSTILSEKATEFIYRR